MHGTLETTLFAPSGKHRWVEVSEGQAFHVGPHERHAFHNTVHRAAQALVITESELTRFFERTGRPLAPWMAPEPST